jgi:glycosyltransferase involved in cell wall biosynthesis
MKLLTIVVSFSGNGGVEKMMVNLINQLACDPDLSIDLLLIRDSSDYLKLLSPEVNQIKLGTQHSVTSFIPITRYLLNHKPDAILVAKERAGKAVLLARFIARNKSPVALRLGTNLARAMQGKSWITRFIRYRSIQFFYQYFTAIIAVSEGVARDTQKISGIPENKIHVIRNPVITNKLTTLSMVAPDHPWLMDKKYPVIIGIGRLTQQKGFDTLIRAFAEINKEIPSRLIILGDGNLKNELLALTHELGVPDKVDFPGFTDNPYAYLKTADLFILSSRWEGSPNALTEAMALGTQVVSTDCPSGPFEVLQGGNIAPLVPVDNVEALSRAAIEVLNKPVESKNIQNAVADYRPEIAAREYRRLLFMPPDIV